MSDFKVGYASVNINPMLGIAVDGYYVPRYASGFIDDLEASAMALKCGGRTILMINVDNMGIDTPLSLHYRADIEAVTGVPAAHIFLSSTHTHTGPALTPPESFPCDETMCERYAAFRGERLADLSRMAVADLKPAKMGFIVGYAPERVAYIRRYKMKDGTTMTCPPINDPNIDHPLGELDQRINVLRFDQEGGNTVVLMNYGLHADTINTDKISSDWPGWTRRTLAAALGDNVKTMCFVGCQGDVGSTHVNPCGGDMNDTEISFDNEMKSPGMARFVGRALAGTVLQVFDKVEYVDVDSIDIIHRDVCIPANTPDKADLPLAHKYKDLHEAGRDCDIPYTAMELTTVVAEAYRMCNLENGPYEYHLDVTGLRIGDVAFVGLPGEPFTDIGRQIKTAEGWKMILPCCITNGYEGYFPTADAYEDGGYEARSSVYKPGVAERLIEAGKAVLSDLHK
ncbi:MAG: hypothetical protein MJ099_02415 [Clostridia bacterium]|nr:hypothetical protein [Clostridia bacterium]